MVCKRVALFHMRPFGGVGIGHVLVRQTEQRRIDIELRCPRNPGPNRDLCDNIRRGAAEQVPLIGLFVPPIPMRPCRVAWKPKVGELR